MTALFYYVIYLHLQDLKFNFQAPYINFYNIKRNKIMSLLRYFDSITSKYTYLSNFNILNKVQKSFKKNFENHNFFKYTNVQERVFKSHAKISGCSHFDKTAAVTAYKNKARQHMEQSLTYNLELNFFFNLSSCVFCSC